MSKNSETSALWDEFLARKKAREARWRAEFLALWDEFLGPWKGPQRRTSAMFPALWAEFIARIAEVPTRWAEFKEAPSDERHALKFRAFRAYMELNRELWREQERRRRECDRLRPLPNSRLCW